MYYKLSKKVNKTFITMLQMKHILTKICFINLNFMVTIKVTFIVYTLQTLQI